MASDSMMLCIQVIYHNGLLSKTYELCDVCRPPQSLRKFIDSYK
jgi:hypothetical protein